MIYIGIDPGPELNGLVIVEKSAEPTFAPVLLGAAKLSYEGCREAIRTFIQRLPPSSVRHVRLLIEFPCFYRTAVGGGPILRTAEACGRFREFWFRYSDAPVIEITRPDVCQALLGGTKGVTKAQIKGRVKELWVAMHEVRSGDPVGTKKNPGPLYMMRETTDDHHWDALALVTTYFRGCNIDFSMVGMSAPKEELV